MKKIYLLLLSVLFVTACTTEIPTTLFQKWGKYDIRLESRPPIIEKGMIEFLALVNYEGNMRGWDLVVYFRMGPTGPWKQAIQDGHTGVYRKAMRVIDPATDVLYVHLKRNQTLEQKAKKVEREEIVLTFPLNYSTAAAPSKSGS